MLKYGIASISLFRNKNDRTPYFDIQYSKFGSRYSNAGAAGYENKQLIG
jgi:hypothetical protein